MKVLAQSKITTPVSASWHFHDKHNLYDYSNVFVGDRVKSIITGEMGAVVKKRTIEVHAMLPTDFIWVEWDNKEVSHPYPHQIAIDLTHRQNNEQNSQQRLVEAS